jgi:hypothetical protein
MDKDLLEMVRKCEELHSMLNKEYSDWKEKLWDK